MCIYYCKYLVHTSALFTKFSMRYHITSEHESKAEQQSATVTLANTIWQRRDALTHVAMATAFSMDSATHAIHVVSTYRVLPPHYIPTMVTVPSEVAGGL